LSYQVVRNVPAVWGEPESHVSGDFGYTGRV
jgi:hypothetical protein